MPESKGRKSVQRRKAKATRERRGSAAASGAPPKGSPRWWAPTMVALMVLGLVLVVTTYLTRGELPVPGWGNGNLLLGFGVMLVGFLMTTRWR